VPFAYSRGLARVDDRPALASKNAFTFEIWI
jgi:hypothetical protein